MLTGTQQNFWYISPNSFMTRCCCADTKREAAFLVCENLFWAIRSFQNLNSHLGMDRRDRQRLFPAFRRGSSLVEAPTGAIACTHSQPRPSAEREGRREEAWPSRSHILAWTLALFSLAVWLQADFYPFWTSVPSSVKWDGNSLVINFHSH